MSYHVSLIPRSVRNSKSTVAINLRAGVFRGAGRKGCGSGWQILPSGAWGLVEKGQVWCHRVLRVYRHLCRPQALDDANKGIIEELKKTNYRDILKDKKEKGEFLETPPAFLLAAFLPLL